MTRNKFVWSAVALVAALAASPARAEDQVLPPSIQTAGHQVSMITPNPVARPAALVPLYVSFGVLQAADIATTLHNISGGATEANPVMGTVAGSPAGLVATKAALAGASIFLAEKLWKKNRPAAVLLMIGLNGFQAAVVARNYATRAGR